MTPGNPSASKKEILGRFENTNAVLKPLDCEAWDSDGFSKVYSGLSPDSGPSRKQNEGRFERAGLVTD
jgi:hypothetical protein